MTKVDILVPAGRVMWRIADRAINQMYAYAIRSGYDAQFPDLAGSAMVDRARNLALQRIRPDADYVLWCDDDMAPAPDALVRLLKYERPVVSALCTTREMPLALVPKAWDASTDRFVPIDRFRPDALVQGKFGVGMGFLLIQRKTLFDALEFHLSGRDWLALHKRELERLCVKAEYRERERARKEKIRRALWEQSKVANLFHFSRQDNEEYRGEDIHFSRLLLEMGVEIAIDTGVQVGHVAEFPMGPWCMGINDTKDLRFAEANPDGHATD